MPARTRMCFRSVGGDVVPINPRDQHGTPIIPDGRLVLDINQAARRFNADRLTLAVLFARVLGPTLGAATIAELIDYEGSIDPLIPDR